MIFNGSNVISVQGTLSQRYYTITTSRKQSVQDFATRQENLLSDIEKFIDRRETKMTDIDPSIVGHYVRPLKNNYFKPCFMTPIDSANDQNIMGRVF